MKVYKKAILPLGFAASAVSCGIKKSGKPDLALFYSDIFAKASCKFTKNCLAAAPIKVNKEILKTGRDFQAIIVNSGNANAFTGVIGIKDTKEISRSLAGYLGISYKNILSASTGIIGRRLPVDKIKRVIPALVRNLSLEGINQAKKAILTTDTFAKEITVRFQIGKVTVTVCGIAKGAGMIAPDMATMLCFILTDANITKRAMDNALSKAVDNSFNCITVDGCMSTNDSLMLLANGASNNHLIDLHANFDIFMSALGKVCLELSKMIVRDAEGATKFIRITVKEAASFKEAKAAALAIANSNLFKTAIYGENPNFGRIVAAIGASGVRAREDKLKVKVSNLNRKDIFVDVSLGQAKASATIYTSDLTPAYIKINARYN
ncbi:MAG: bifunctional glutamate N-acetyltransferase/amino-acid acetyltransferase ArgJ [Candidatus Omnitrophica bacterium]|nr:bifunctional glutamate N-acetyltransferase/amino-acid acetyltransferase ArgJ [Candidatus Omnitrophota bacterium]